MRNSRGKHAPTLKDLAELSGYSINTVSRALREKDDIAAGTREKIKRYAQELGYTNNMIAKSLRVGYTSTIAVILGDVSNPHFAIMMKEIQQRAQEMGYSSFLINTNEDEDLEREAIREALNKNVDGIIICPVQESDHNIEYLKNTGTPFVLIGRYFQTIPSSYVVCNDEQGGIQAASYLLENGHKDILMLNAPNYISSARERLAGYKKAHTLAGVECKQELIHEIPFTSEECQESIKKIINSDLEFTAIFAFSDMLAWIAWYFLQEKRKKVPEDCSIIGFDHIQSRMILPFRLSSISSFKGRMSTESVDTLVKLMKDSHREQESQQQIVIDTALVEGETVCGKSA